MWVQIGEVFEIGEEIILQKGALVRRFMVANADGDEFADVSVHTAAEDLEIARAQKTVIVDEVELIRLRQDR